MTGTSCLRTPTLKPFSPTVHCRVVQFLIERLKYKLCTMGLGDFTHYTRQAGSVVIRAPRVEGLGLIYMYRGICLSGRKEGWR